MQAAAIPNHHLPPRLRHAMVRGARLIVWVSAALVMVGCGPKASAGDNSAASGDAVMIDATDTGLGRGADSGDKVDAGDEADGKASCPGGAGCACETAKDCDDALCVDTNDGRVCAGRCVDTCPAGHACLPVVGGADAQTYCVPSWGVICRPCSQNATCTQPGITDASCVAHGNSGGFCGAACAADADCPPAYHCQQAQDVDSATVKQCVPDGDGDGGMGACVCSAVAVAKALGTDCWLKETGAGGQQQRCKGHRFCEISGLSACTKLTGPGAQCLDEACAGQPDDTACDDKDTCTVNDHCKGGVCLPGTLNCACTKDADCNKADGGPVDLCIGQKYCDKSGATPVCAVNPVSVVTCATSQNTACRINTCNPKTGTCALKDLPAATTCQDGDACTTDEQCDGKGACVSKNAVCCQNSADCAKFEDGDPCNGTLYCSQTSDGNSCVINPASVVTCPSVADTACVKNTCQPETQLCMMTTVKGANIACDDGDVCTVGETCVGSACVASAAAHVCSCTKDADCAAKEDGDLCNGQLFCNVAIGKCQPNPATVVTCATAGNTSCSALACQPKTGKCLKSDMKDGTTCDADGDGCTANDACGAGVCKPGTQICTCKSNADCAAFEDGNLCNGTLYCFKSGATATCKVNPATLKTCPSVDDTACVKNLCQPKTGQCKTTQLPKGAPCEDGFVCSIDDTCNAGTCESGAAGCPCKVVADCAQFDDDNPCTTPVCTVKSNCAQIFNEAPCDDGDACTLKDTCAQGVCVGGAKDTCDDGTVCTLDGCEAKTGCVHQNTSASCNDDDACTSNDACAGGKCIPGAKVPCDDKNLCTTDSCDVKKGCVHAPLSVGTVCGGTGVCSQTACVCPASMWVSSAVCASCGCNPAGSVGSPATKPVVTAPTSVPGAKDADAHGFVISSDGEWLAAGAPYHDAKSATSGSVVMYKRQASGAWAYHSRVFGSTTSHLDHFGSTVQLIGDRLLVGSWGEDNSKGSNSGVVYEFTRQPDDAWKETARLVDSTGYAQLRLGWSLSAEANRFAAGAPTLTYGNGRAAIFERDAKQAWKQITTLKPTGLTAGKASGWRDYFGAAIALSGDRIAVGGQGDASKGDYTGAVFVFERQSNGTWPQKTKLMHSKAAVGEHFGSVLTMDGDALVVGVPYLTGKADPVGGVVTFLRATTGAWQQSATIPAPAQVAKGDLFGASVALRGVDLLVGASARDANGVDSGAVYVYKRDASTNAWKLQHELIGTVAGAKLGFSVAFGSYQAFAGAIGVFTGAGGFSQLGLQDFNCSAAGQCSCKTGFSGSLCVKP